jgi:hypothetical protein
LIIFSIFYPQLKKDYCKDKDKDTINSFCFTEKIRVECNISGTSVCENSSWGSLDG